VKPAPPDPGEVSGALWGGVSGNIAWDVGANCGQTIGILAHRFGQVVAFEPAHECLAHLWPVCVKAAEVACATIAVRPIAISDHDGEVSLIAVPDKINTGQLVTAGTYGMEWTPDAPGAQARVVTCRSLDSLAEELPAPDFLKVDVEGHEGAVLDGARRPAPRQLLTGQRPSWLIEFHTPDLHRYCSDLLAQHGYQVTTVRHPHYRPGTPMWFQHGWLTADWYP
jgi:FkbM family methyltransferase